MPPKQATLGLVKPQQTLGKFFGKPNNSKPPAQQSVISLGKSKKAKASSGEAVEGEDDVAPPTKKRRIANDSNEVETNGDVSMNDAPPSNDAAAGPDETSDLNPDKSTHRETDTTNISSSTTINDNKSTEGTTNKTRKNQEEQANDGEEDEDEEPVTTRRRRSTKPKEAEIDSKKTGSRKEKASSSEKDIVTVKKEPATVKKGSLAGKSKAFTVKTEAESLEDTKTSANASKDLKEETVELKKESVKEEKSAPKTKVRKAKEEPLETTPAEDEAAASDVDEEHAESDEETPEIAAKAREKVQATLKGSGKDPYPDWKPGEPVPYAALCTTFSLIEMTTKRLIISAHCSLFLRQVLRLTPDDLLPTIHLMINKLAPDYAGIELGIGESLIMKAIGETTGRSNAIIKADQAQIGDLGLVAAKSRSNQPTMFKPKPLTVKGVLDGLMGVALVSGHGSQDKKIAGIKKLLSAADTSAAGKGSKGIDITKDKGGASETKFIIRFLEGKLRLGLAEKTVLTALAHAMVVHETEKKGNKVPSNDALSKGEEILKSVYSELPSYEVIVPAILEHGIFHLRENCKLQPGVPLKPMLAKPTKSITEVLDRFEGKTFTCEYKYDGERAQIHYVAEDSPQQYASSEPGTGKNAKGLSAIFSRNSEDLSKKYPDILGKLYTWIKPETKSFVLDCETVAWDLKEKKVLPFQQLMTRKRKDVKTEDVTVQVCVFAFDMLFYNGESVVEKSLQERRDLLYGAFTEVESEFRFAQYGNTNELEEIQVLLDESVKASCEGLMVKMLDSKESSYEPSKRSQNWLKVKKDYLSGVGDSLDLVVLGAYYGKGKRTSVYGAFLLACYNSSKQVYETVCNIGTGFSEAILEELHSKLSENTIDKPKPFYSHSQVPKEQPDVWFEPRFVWEVKTADLTLSPRYKAGADALNDASGKGISLRFPRFIKEREDKKTEEATGSRMVVEMYQKQESVSKNKGPSVDDDFEY